jgi:HSP20 family protein
MTMVKFNSDDNKNGSIAGFNQVFDSIFNDTFFSDRIISRVPAANISETADHYHIELAAPGLKKEDFKLKLEREVLTVSVEQLNQNQEQQRKFARREFSFSSFVRAFTLPESANVEGIQARYNEGVLCIDIPKREEAKMISREIEIQ